MIYLLVHLVLSRQNHSASRGGASTPWTEYVKFLPRPIPIPTMWTEAERALLQGTSLEVSYFFCVILIPHGQSPREIKCP